MQEGAVICPIEERNTTVTDRVKKRREVHLSVEGSELRLVLAQVRETDRRRERQIELLHFRLRHRVHFLLFMELDLK